MALEGDGGDGADYRALIAKVDDVINETKGSFAAEKVRPPHSACAI